MTMELKSAGEVDVQLIELIASSGKSLDVRNQVVAINIYESIFTPFITGDLVIKDALDLINFFPITGEEYLNITIATPGFTEQGTFIKNKFIIYKVSDREEIADSCLGYKLNFISIEAVMDLNVKISKAFNDSIGNIASKLLEEFSVNEDKNRNHVEPTLNNMSYVSNFWTPVQNLNYLAEHAVNVNNSPTYLFFENRNGLNFLSLETLYNATQYQTFYNDNYSRPVNKDGTSVRDIEADYKRIIGFKVPTVFDYIDRIRSGAFSSTLITHDITSKRYVSNAYDFLDEYDKETRLNKYPIVSKKAPHYNTAAIKTLHKSTSIFSGGNDITNSRYFQRRKSLLALAESCKINITILGRTDYTVGQKIYFETTKIMPIDKTDVDTMDHVFSGDYIVSSLHHKINRESHMIDVELIKDSLDLDLNKVSV